MSYPTASFKRRFCSLSYEILLLSAISMTVLFLTVLLASFLGEQVLLTQILAVALLLIAWGFYFRKAWLKGGQTLPMRMWRLRLENKQGELMSSTQAWIRFFWALLFFVVIPVLVYVLMRGFLDSRIAACLGLFCWTLPVGYAFFNQDQQFLHDRLAGTRLVSLEKQ